jgi:hypothetical protein
MGCLEQMGKPLMLRHYPALRANLDNRESAIVRNRRMPINPCDRQKNNVAHARWRVKFLLSILYAHRCEGVRSPGWVEKEAAYLHQIAEAQVELDRVEWRATSPGVGGLSLGPG